MAFGCGDKEQIELQVTDYMFTSIQPPKFTNTITEIHHLLDLERSGSQVRLSSKSLTYLSTMINMAYQVLAKLREECLGLVVSNTGVDDHILAFLPVDGGGNAVFIADLKGCGSG